MSRTTAQVACEAIINHPEDGYDLATAREVLNDARRLGVPELYRAMLAEWIVERTRVLRDMGADL